MTKFKRRIFGTLLAVVMLAGCGAESSRDDENTLFHQGLLAISIGDDYGYIDESGKFVIQPQFSYAEDFNNKGLALAWTDNHLVIINTEGEITAEIVAYDNAKRCVSFYGEELGISPARLNGKYGYINKDYEWVIEPQFDYLSDYNRSGLIYARIDGTSDKDDRYGFIDMKGKWIIESKFDVGSFDLDPCFGAFELAAVQVDEKWGFMDKKGSFKIEPQFNRAENFSEDGLAAVFVNGKWGYINLSGKLIIEPHYDHAYDFKMGVAFVELDDKIGLINMQGEYILEPQFDSVTEFKENGLAIVKQGYDFSSDDYDYFLAIKEDDGKRYYLIDTKGNILITSNSDQELKWYFEPTNSDSSNILYCNNDGIIIADWVSFETNDAIKIRFNDKFGYIDKQGNYISEPKYDYAGDFDENGYAIVGVGERYDLSYGVINKKGQYTVEPKKYQQIKGTFGNGLYAIKSNDKWGWIDTEGNYVLNPQFDEIGNITDNGRASVLLNEKWGYIDIMTGEWIVEPIYEGNYLCIFFDDGYVLCHNGNSWGIGDFEGNYVVNPQFKYVSKDITSRWYY